MCNSKNFDLCICIQGHPCRDYVWRHDGYEITGTTRDQQLKVERLALYVIG